MATDPPQAENLPYWLKKFSDQRREAILQEYRKAREGALAVPSAMFVHEITTPLWAQAQQRITLLEAEMAALQASLPIQWAEAALDDQRRELFEEEP